MSKVIDEVINFATSVANFHKIYGVIISGNHASIRLLEKINFKKEAHLKEHSFKDGQYLDEIIYSLIASKNK